MKCICRRAGAIALWLVVLFVLPCRQSWGLRGDSTASSAPLQLKHLLDAEIDATKQQLRLYKRKAELITETLAKLESRLGHNASASNGSPVSVTAHQQQTFKRHQRNRASPQLFRDWFAPHSSFPLPHDGSGMLPRPQSAPLARLISFRPQTRLVGKRQQQPQRKFTSGSVEDEAPLQFLLVLDPHTTVLRLFHPLTHELVWQHALNLRSSAGGSEGAFGIADVFFMSERSAHLAVLSTAGDLMLFKLRLWHNRRVISGDHRRLIPLRDLRADQLRCLAGQREDSISEALRLPWTEETTPSLTAPPPGRFLHVDVERVFDAALSRDWRYDRGKVTVIALYHHVYVVTSDGSGGHLSFFHGRNGSFITDLHIQTNTRNSHDRGVVQLEPVQSTGGLLALTTRSQVQFVDVTIPMLLPVACEAPERQAFTSLAVDPQRPFTVYAGASTGRGFVFRLYNFQAWRQRSNGEEQEHHEPAVCALVGQLAPRRPPLSPPGGEAPALVQTVHGFLVLATGARLVLYQLPTGSEGLRPTYLSERSLVASPLQELDWITSPSSPKLEILGVSTAKDPLMHSVGLAVLVAVPQDEGAMHVAQRLDVYESRLPPPASSLDLTWVRVPAMMICALAAMFWQQKGRLAQSAGGSGAFDEAELLGLLGRQVPNLESLRGSLAASQRTRKWS
ncbi:hypothetical protein BBJ28_00005866 [Nothophytophthora sp. Chile5]|nr:hypothetical protein BBJ28_00005866 [Nothophytophthora sp. Chile5]